MPDHKTTIGTLASAIEQFLKVTTSFAPGLFHCYQVPDLPRTNTAPEQCFGSVRHHERRGPDDAALFLAWSCAAPFA
ncbi:hypothetical protein [Ktedonobacter sp. SOSP1-52]|uniref:hypothetical protein n=1 Tax=Ktedonobacter sp. SOSP1-52 TaxID=2778366 RepID=UPI001916BD3C|nr:hypothetical protein [Ktedonobacter sp. SOSP1-52]